MDAYLPIFNAGVDTGEKQWYNFTNPNVSLQSTHRYWFAEWFDDRTTVQQSILVFAIGDDKILYWTGGFAPVVSKTSNSITTDKNWSLYGFSDEYTSQIVINGTVYDVTSTFNSPTINVTQATTDVAVNDVAFDTISQKSMSGNTIFDVCSTVNNQVYYKDWKQRNGFISWNRNQNASTTMD